MVRIFKADDFKSVYQEIHGTSSYVGPLKPEQRELLATTANIALNRIIGLEHRFSKSKWSRLYLKMRDYGDALNAIIKREEGKEDEL